MTTIKDLPMYRDLGGWEVLDSMLPSDPFPLVPRRSFLGGRFRKLPDLSSGAHVALARPVAIHVYRAHAIAWSFYNPDGICSRIDGGTVRETTAAYALALDAGMRFQALRRTAFDLGIRAIAAADIDPDLILDLLGVTLPPISGLMIAAEAAAEQARGCLGEARDAAGLAERVFAKALLVQAGYRLPETAVAAWARSVPSDATPSGSDQARMPALVGDLVPNGWPYALAKQVSDWAAKVPNNADPDAWMAAAPHWVGAGFDQVAAARDLALPLADRATHADLATHAALRLMATASN